MNPPSDDSAGPPAGAPAPPWPAPVVTTPAPAPAPVAPVGRDLAGNVAGASVRAKRDEVNTKAPVRNLLARILSVHTEERAWRVGAKGEEKVGRDLARLGPGWRVLHNVPVGDQGSDIDHLVVGPGGVFTLNTKRHPDGNIWIGDRVVMVNGAKTDYLRNARFEARRAAKILGIACRQAIDVSPVIVLVDIASFTVKGVPDDVTVLRRVHLVRWLQTRPVVLTADRVDAIFAAARQSATWVR